MREAFKVQPHQPCCKSIDPAVSEKRSGGAETAVTTGIATFNFGTPFHLRHYFTFSSSPQQQQQQPKQ